MELFDLTTKQADTLRAALDSADKVVEGDHRVLAALRRRGLISDDDHTVTELGRYQVRWYADDCARHWGIETGTWHQYVKRETAPAAADKGIFGSSVVRPWWDPRTVIDFKRPTRAHREGLRERELDMVQIVRQFRAGVSIRELARANGVAVTTIASRLEGMGEKPETTATRTERERRMAGNNPTRRPA